MTPKLMFLLTTAYGSGPPIVSDSAEDDVPICEFEAVYPCDYRATELYASCTDYSLSAMEYLDHQSIKSKANELSEICTNNNATWGEGPCPVDDTWMGVCVNEVDRTIGLVYGTHDCSEPELVLTDGNVILYDDASASAICSETDGAEACNDAVE